MACAIKKSLMRCAISNLKENTVLKDTKQKPTVTKIIKLKGKKLNSAASDMTLKQNSTFTVKTV